MSIIYNRTNKFGINYKLHFDFIFSNWRHHKSNKFCQHQQKPEVAEQPTKNIIPEINITQQQEKEQQKQNEQQKKEILVAQKRPESYEKRVAHPLEQRPEKTRKCHLLRLL